MDSIFEIVMLICFGAAWPVSILKSYRSRATGGKSVIFLMIVEAGYISGIVHKILNDNDGIIFLYCFNAVLVLVDILLYFRNRGLEIRTQADIKRG